jgi:uncharacterized protein (DUF1330 family)
MRDKLIGVAKEHRIAVGGRILVRPVRSHKFLRAFPVLIEFDSVASAIAAHDSPAYQAALKVLGDAAVRDIRIVQGID